MTNYNKHIHYLLNSTSKGLNVLMAIFAIFYKKKITLYICNKCLLAVQPWIYQADRFPLRSAPCGILTELM